MLDVADFVTDRGGDPKKIKESQRRRFAPEDIVDEVLGLYEDARRSNSFFFLSFFLSSFFFSLFSIPFQFHLI